jgi:hypothetical protein
MVEVEDTNAKSETVWISGGTPKTSKACGLCLALHCGCPVHCGCPLYSRRWAAGNHTSA